MSDSLSDRLFWFITVLAALLFGGFIYFFATMFSRPAESPVTVATARKEPAPHPKPASEVAALPEESPAESQTSESPAMAAAAEEDTYIEIPANKPFLSREDFTRPRPRAPPVKKPLTPPVKSAKPAPQNAITKLLDKRKVVVMNSGRKIVAMSIVDLGDFIGIKDENNQTLTVKKEDVSKIERP